MKIGYHSIAYSDGLNGGKLLRVFYFNMAPTSILAGRQLGMKDITLCVPEYFEMLYSVPALDGEGEVSGG